MAEMIEANGGRDGKVRNVTLRYKIQTPSKQGSKSAYTGTPDIVVRRSVHRLVLILEAEERP